MLPSCQLTHPSLISEATVLENFHPHVISACSVKDRFEETYSKTRIINKPQNYILDQDHHNHLANQMLSFNWQFTAELMMFEKISNQLKAIPN